MSADKIRALFERRRERPFEPRLAEVVGSYRFDIERVGSFFVSVDRGYLALAELVRDADCIISCGPDEFLAIAEGRQNLLTAAMQGLIEIRGDLSLAQKLHGMLPVSERAPAEQGGAHP